MRTIAIFFVLTGMMVISCQNRNQFTSNNSEKSETQNESKKEIQIVKPIIYNDSVYKIPEILASFHGGEYTCMKFFEENLKFPKEIENNNVSSVVFLKFIVELDSTASNIKIIRGVNDAFNKEAIRLINLAKWNPGKVNGIPVRSEFAIPVHFRNY